MKHRMKQWFVPLIAGLFVLSILVLPSLGVGREAEAAAKYRYDPNKAISSASAILDQYVQENKSSQGARYVSAVLRAGGLTPVDEGGAGNLIACLNTPSKFGGVIGKVIADPTSNDLRPGDVLAVVCSKGSTSATYAGAHGQGSSFWGVQDFFVSKVNRNNTVEIYSYRGKDLGGRYHATIDLGTIAKSSFSCNKCGNSSSLHLIGFSFTPSSACTVTFNGNGGYVDTTSKTVTSGYTCGTLPTPTRAGWRFVGWFTAKKGGSLVTSGTVITQDTVLFAQWVRIKTYQVTFNGNGGKSSLNRKPVPGGDTLGTLPTATRRGYIFAGWYTAKVGGEQVSSSTMVTGKMTVFAHWEPIYYTFDINATLDGAGRSNLEGVGAVDVYINGRLVARNVTEYKTALPYGTKYRIKVRPINGMKNRGVQKGCRLSGKVMEYTEVVLRFETVTYAVRFQGNGGRAPVSQTSVKGGQTIGDLPVPTRSGYDFVGWYTAKKGGTRVTEQTIITGKTTLFAHWEKHIGPVKVGWKYVPEDDCWYYVSANGSYYTGWQTINGKRYYFMPNGAMRTGLIRIGGVLYFFNNHPPFSGWYTSASTEPRDGYLHTEGFGGDFKDAMLFSDDKGVVLACDDEIKWGIGEEEDTGRNFATNARAILDQFDNVGAYAFFDVDKDGVNDFIVRDGEDYMDLCFHVFLANKNTGEYRYVGNLGGGIYLQHDGHGNLIIADAHHGSQVEYQVIYSGGELTKQFLLEFELDEHTSADFGYKNVYMYTTDLY